MFLCCVCEIRVYIPSLRFWKNHYSIEYQNVDYNGVNPDHVKLINPDYNASLLKMFLIYNIVQV